MSSGASYSVPFSGCADSGIKEDLCRDRVIGTVASLFEICLLSGCVGVAGDCVDGGNGVSFSVAEGGNDVCAEVTWRGVEEDASEVASE